MKALALSREQINDLTKPLGLEPSDDLRRYLIERLELSTRQFMQFFDEIDQSISSHLDKEWRAELDRVATDPARSLEYAAESTGGQIAREILEVIAQTRNIDLETRSGAAKVGDLARQLSVEKASRVDVSFRQGTAQIFTDIVETLHAIAPHALEGWPSNEAESQDCHATDFAAAFIEIVADSAIERMPVVSRRAQKWITHLRNKTPRALMGDDKSGLRVERRWVRDQELGFDRGAEIIF